jgi:hypothetical protein
VKYELVPLGNRRFAFIPHDLRYFEKHFRCEPMANGWKLPPVTSTGASYKPADFVLWMLRAPIVSGRAKEALQGLCEDLVEFLPFHPIKSTSLYAVNVLTRDSGQPIFKEGPDSLVFVDERIGEVIRDQRLTGVALADPAIGTARRVVRGKSLHDFPGLAG